MTAEVNEFEFPPEDMDAMRTRESEDSLSDSGDVETDPSDEGGHDQVFPDGSHHLGERLDFTNEHLPNEYDRPDIELTNRRRCHLVYRDVDDLFDSILDLEDDVKDPKFIDSMISRGFAINIWLG